MAKNALEYLAPAAEETGVSSVKADTEAANGIYDLMGRQVSNPTRGLYIINGSKVLVK